MNIRDARKKKGFTQSELAEATGLDQGAISRMENGKQSITLEQLRRIARALGVRAEALVRDLAA